jgi:hypothetical protein
MEDVSGKQDDVRGELDDAVDRRFEGPGDIGLALVDAAWSQSLILTKPEVQVGKMDEAHERKYSVGGVTG